MKDGNDNNTLDITANVENLPEVLSFLVGNMKELNCSAKELAQIQIVAEEFFVNISSYAYSPGTGRVTIQAVPLVQENAIVLTFTDSGIPFDPLTWNGQDLSTSVADRKKGGLGILFSRKKVDIISYEYVEGKNVLTMKKVFKGEGS